MTAPRRPWLWLTTLLSVALCGSAAGCAGDEGPSGPPAGGADAAQGPVEDLGVGDAGGGGDVGDDGGRQTDAAAPLDLDADGSSPPADAAADDASVNPDATPGDGGEADGGPQPPLPLLGQLNMTLWLPDFLFGYPELRAEAVLSPALAEQGLENAFNWLLLHQGWEGVLGDGYWILPEVGSWARAELADLAEPAGGWGLLDAGLFVACGDELVAHVDDLLLEQEGASVYRSLAEEAAAAAERQDPGLAMDLEVAGGDDIGEGLYPGALRLAEPPRLLGRDPLQPLPLRYGSPLVLRWAPGADAAAEQTAAVTVETPSGALVWHMEDRGVADLDSLLQEAGLALEEGSAVGLARLRHSEVVLPEGRIQVVSASKVWLYGQTVGAYDVSPQILAPGERALVTVRSWDRPLDPALGAWLDLGPHITVEQVEITGAAGHVLQAEVLVAAEAPTGPAPLRAGSRDQPAQVVVPEALWIATPLPGAGDCESATDEGPLPDGTYQADTAGLELGRFDSSSCRMGPADGGDQAVPLRLHAGQTLKARLWGPKLYGALFLVEHCEDPEPGWLCGVSPQSGEPATLEYTALQDEDLLLVASSLGVAGDPRRYLLDVQRSRPAPFVLEPPTLTEGGRQEVLVESFVGPFEPERASFDFGAGFIVHGVSYEGEPPTVALLDLEVPMGARPLVRNVTVRIGGVPHTVAGGVEIRPWIGAAPDCLVAAGSEPLGTGTYEGLTVLGPIDAVGPQPCIGAGADGPEGIYRVDLGPGETLRAEVRMPDMDPVIYLLEGCPGRVLTCSDETGSDDPEFLRFVGPADGATVFLVVDGFGPGDGGVFDLRLDLRR